MAARSVGLRHEGPRSRVLQSAFHGFFVPVEKHAVFDHVADPLAAAGFGGELLELVRAGELVCSSELNAAHHAVI